MSSVSPALHSLINFSIERSFLSIQRPPPRTASPFILYLPTSLPELPTSPSLSLQPQSDSHRSDHASFVKKCQLATLKYLYQESPLASTLYKKTLITHRHLRYFLESPRLSRDEVDFVEYLYILSDIKRRAAIIQGDFAAGINSSLWATVLKQVDHKKKGNDSERMKCARAILVECIGDMEKRHVVSEAFQTRND